MLFSEIIYNVTFVLKISTIFPNPKCRVISNNFCPSIFKSKTNNIPYINLHASRSPNMILL